FRNPKGMAVDSVGNVYVADNMNHTIRMGWSINHKPVADAGADQTAYEGDPVTLDGSGSHDPDGQSLTYLWEQVAGPPVILNHSDTVNPTFTAPPVPQTGSTLTFQLTVSDGQLISDARTMNVTVKNVNHAPAADAGDDQKLNELTLVTLDGSASYDVDSDSISYSWLQTDGPTVILSDATAAKPFFVAPLVGSAGATFTFELTVDDGLAADTDSVTVKIENANHPPTANAGPDQTVNENGTVTLDGIGSNDPDGDSLTYLWVQTSGPEVLLSDASAAKPTFIAPSVAPGGVELVFDLVVSDGLGGTAIDSVTITVLNVIDPPVAELARANPDSLWPPNHKMVPVSIVGVTDPNNNKVTITILAVTQDEPVNGLGDGDTGPDAIIQGDKMLLRAERSGDGNGRVYHISFIADDGDGGTCAGTVKVSVPRDRRQDAVVDNGPRYNSSQP
ncbi:MAG: PKD domain-containing protein, partial [Verrucomicrobiia bacterium]